MYINTGWMSNKNMYDICIYKESTVEELAC